MSLPSEIFVIERNDGVHVSLGTEHYDFFLTRSEAEHAHLIRSAKELYGIVEGNYRVIRYVRDSAAAESALPLAEHWGIQGVWHKLQAARECQAALGADDVCGLPPDSPVHTNPHGHEYQ